MDSLSRSLQGKVSRDSGNFFEAIITDACRFYENKGICVIEKTPEPMRILKPYDRRKGQFVACFEKQAQPDFKGALMDARMVIFDAKHTDTGQIRRAVVTAEQEECFERYMKMGALCFLVISLGFEEYFRVPWVIFRDMKDIYGHKYMDRKDMACYQISYNNGLLRFLDGIELKGTE